MRDPSKDVTKRCAEEGVYKSMRHIRGNQFETYLLIFKYLNVFRSINDICKEFGSSAGYVRSSLWYMEKAGIWLEKTNDVCKRKKYKIDSTERDFYTAMKMPMYKMPRKPKEEKKTESGKSNLGKKINPRREYWFILTR